MTKVLLADDHPFILAGLKAILQGTEYEIVSSVSRGDAVLSEAAIARPDVLILDVNMSGATGIEVLKALRDRGDNRAVILLTASLDDHLIIEAISLGVQGVVLKEAAHDKLIECLEAVRLGKRWIDQGVLQRAFELAQSGEALDPLTALSGREREITSLVSEGRRNKEIAHAIGVTEGTVKVYLHRIYEKLGVGNRTELAVLSRKRG